MIKILNDIGSEGSFVLYDPTSYSSYHDHQVIKIKHKNYFIMQHPSGKIIVYYKDGKYKPAIIGDS